LKVQFFDEKPFNADRVDKLRKTEKARYTRRYFAVEYWKEDIPGNTGNHGFTYFDPTHHERFQLLWHGIESIVLGGTLLDVGCGTGLLVEVGLNRGNRVSGVDVATSAIAEFHNRTKHNWPEAVHFSDITALNIDDFAYDTSLCFDVLEHIIVFDIFSAVAELCRVARKKIIASINLDNPYEYHPTILSRGSWIALFEASGMANYNEQETAILSEIVCPLRPEYDFFVFDRVRS